MKEKFSLLIGSVYAYVLSLLHSNRREICFYVSWSLFDGNTAPHLGPCLLAISSSPLEKQLTQLPLESADWPPI